MILAGDIGGTNTRLAFCEVQAGAVRPLTIEIFPSKEHGNLDEIVAKFVAKAVAPADRRVLHSCFGIAGPVKNGRCETTNLPWVVDSSALARQLGIPTVSLINDLEANAWGIPALAPEDFATLNEGAPGASGNAVVVSAGTGLGEAGITWDGSRGVPFASEGGHSDFAPQSDIEIELLRFLGRELGGHVSVERVLSGPGLHNIYRFLRDTGMGKEDAALAEDIRSKGAPAAISSAALAGSSELCVRAMDLFVSIYGAEAGNMALKAMATGGVYIGGGIAPRIVARLRRPGFMEAFLAKGRMRPLLEAMHVRVILNDKTA
ncbi:MAG: glucokinase, partial [Vicinamibacteria bacterium]